MNMQTVTIVAHPRELVWRTLRDRMGDIAATVPDLESVVTQSRLDRDEDVVQLTNIWTPRVQLPALLGQHIRPDMLKWTDHAEWNARTHECRWRIEPHGFADSVTCHGTTLYEPALGGKGTRVTFRGELEVRASGIKGIPAALERPALKLVEMVVTTLVPKNFRNLVEASARVLADSKNTD